MKRTNRSKLPPSPDAAPDSDDFSQRILYGEEIAPYWLGLNWWDLACRHYPEIKLEFSDGPMHGDQLFNMIAGLAGSVNAHFELAAHWVLRRALGAEFWAAREMDKGNRPWDPAIQYVCRVVSLQLCRNRAPNSAIEIGLVDHMIRPLLLPDEELLHEMQPINLLPC